MRLDESMQDGANFRGLQPPGAHGSEPTGREATDLLRFEHDQL